MNDLALHPRNFSPSVREMAYAPPRNVREIDLGDLLARHGGEPFEPKQLDLVFGKEAGQQERRTSKPIWYAGNLESLRAPAVAIVGTRKVSPEGAARARKLARGLASAGVAVVSGLAEGVDTEALTEAMKSGGRVAAVIGTPINKAYPAKNAALQEAIYRDHLLISQFPIGTRTFRSHFPERNRLMAAVSDATVVIEASDTSGTLHQSAECVKLGRWLFITKAVAEDRSLTWPEKFIGKYEKCVVLERLEDVLDRLLVNRPA
jgi:DNA processing protein